MNTYKYDIHVHTSETSSCGKVRAKDLAGLYKAAGYHGIVITDHYYGGFFNKLKAKSWSDKIDLYLEGYRIALEEGKKQGLIVLPGIEITFPENSNDYLVYGIDEKFLKENKELFNLGLKGLRDHIKGTGFVLVQAHPFRPFMIPADPSLLDGIEVYNGNKRHDPRNHLAYDYALKYGLRMVSGSDFHREEDAGMGGIIVPREITTPAQLADTIRNGMITELIRN